MTLAPDLTLNLAPLFAAFLAAGMWGVLAGGILFVLRTHYADYSRYAPIATGIGCGVLNLIYAAALTQYRCLSWFEHLVILMALYSAAGLAIVLWRAGGDLWAQHKALEGTGGGARTG